MRMWRTQPGAEPVNFLWNGGPATRRPLVIGAVEVTIKGLSLRPQVEKRALGSVDPTYSNRNHHPVAQPGVGPPRVHLRLFCIYLCPFWGSDAVGHTSYDMR